MERTYDIFEVLPDENLVWRACITGHDAALAKAKELAAHSANEFRVIYIREHATIAILNSKPVAPSDSERGKRPPSEGPTDSPKKLSETTGANAPVWLIAIAPGQPLVPRSSHLS